MYGNNSNAYTIENLTQDIYEDFNYILDYMPTYLPKKEYLEEGVEFDLDEASDKLGNEIEQLERKIVEVREKMTGIVLGCLAGKSPKKYGKPQNLDSKCHF
jgi:hypothetical protein